MSNLKSTTAIFSVPKDRLGCHRTRESHGERRQPAGRTALPVPGDCSPAARKLRMFARMAVPPPPGPLAQCRGRASREDCRAEGSIPTPGRQARCLVSTHRGPRGPMRSAGLVTSDASSAGLGWYRLPPRCGASCLGRTRLRAARRRLQLILAPAPRTPTRTGLAVRTVPRHSNVRADVLPALTPELRAHAPGWP